MRLRTKAYLMLITIVIFLEIGMIYLYLRAANEFQTYQLYELLNLRRDNDFEGGIGLLFIAIFFQIILAIYLVYKDRQTYIR